MEQRVQELRDMVEEQFVLPGRMTELKPFGNGHINDTFLVVCETEDGKKSRYVLQRVNNDVFKDMDGLMDNVVHVTAFLRKKIEAAGGDPARETLTVIPTKQERYYIHREDGNYRLYTCIEDAFCMEEAESVEDFYNSAVAFGNFQRLLSDYPASDLHETIPDFHNTVSRFANLKKAVEEDVCGRRKDVEQEIAFAMEREADCHVICDALAEGRIPLRVTHNDTKLNNIMMDNQTKKGICVIDLDTVMPGSALYDYGDSIRFGASTGAEDEQNLDLISCDLELFEAYTKGFIEGCGGSLTKEEIRLMPMGAKLMTLECGMRFLTDHLEGDVYFKIHRPGHNLDRARTQFKLVADMEAKWEQMAAIVEKYL